MSAYEELKTWCKKNNVGYIEWKSEYTDAPCLALNEVNATFRFCNDGSLAFIEH